MADVTVFDGTASTAENSRGLKGPYWVSPTTGYILLLTSGTLACYKTADSGASWTIQDAANDPTNVTSADAYFDGTVIHVAYLDDVDDFAAYNSFSTATNLWSGRVFVAEVLSVGAAALAWISITKAVGGNLYIASRPQEEVDNDAFYRSTDSGATWSARTSVWDASTHADQCLLVPGNAADTQDIMAIYWDISALELSRKIYDDSANTWAETAIATIAAATPLATTAYWWDAVRRNSDGAILLAFWNNIDVATADLQTYAITESAITAKTNIVTNSDDCACVGLFINQQNDDVYAAYLGSSAGTQTWTATVQAFYKLSTDDLATWGAQAAYGTENDDQRAISCGQGVGNDGGRFMPVWFNDDLFSFMVNDGLDIEVAAAGGAPTGTVASTLARMTASLAGSEKFTGTLAGTFRFMSAALSGSMKIPGQMAATLPRMQADFLGSAPEHYGPMASTLAPMTAAMQGSQATAEAAYVRLLGGMPRRAFVVDEWGSPEQGGTPYKTAAGEHKVDLVSQYNATPSPYKTDAGVHKAVLVDETTRLVAGDTAFGGHENDYKAKSNANKAREDD
jgi:hypothetical protein